LLFIEALGERQAAEFSQKIVVFLCIECKTTKRILPSGADARVSVRQDRGGKRVSKMDKRKRC